ncbi:MAG: hypothetical protein Q9183_002515 [Haloplaca sp. 2 TL-2023]
MRFSHSLLLLCWSFLVQLIVCIPQGSPAPALLQSAGGEDDDSGSSIDAEDGCSGCAIIADVAGIVWYDEIFINTVATAAVSVNNGNGTARAPPVTRTSIIENARMSTVNSAQFTFNPDAGASAFGTFPIQAINVGYNSITTIAGATLYVTSWFSLSKFC